MSSFDFKIPHRNWEEALAESFAFMTTASPGEVVCIVGPSRAGKTRLIEHLKSLFDHDDLHKSPGSQPVVVVDAINSAPNGTFSTKDFIQRMLEEIHHPIFAVGDDIEENEIRYQKIDTTTETVLRRALERGLRARDVSFLIIDEAQHIKYATKGAVGAYAVMDSLKCLAKTANLILVVVGAYPILDILQNSPHLLGRKHQVHFARYKLTEEDLTEFAGIVAAYEEHLEICKSLGSLVSVLDLLYDGSLGCIGLLRAWLLRAKAIATIKKQKIDREILTKTVLSDVDLQMISKEIQVGESMLKQGGNFTKNQPSNQKNNKKKPIKNHSKENKNAINLVIGLMRYDLLSTVFNPIKRCWVIRGRVIPFISSSNCI